MHQLLLFYLFILHSVTTVHFVYCVTLENASDVGDNSTIDNGTIIAFSTNETVSSMDNVTEVSATTSFSVDDEIDISSGINVRKDDLGNIVCKECICDLTADACDYNCCCDKLCAESDFKIFTSCDNAFLPTDQRFCMRRNMFYKVNIDYKMMKMPCNIYCPVPSKKKTQACLKQEEPLNSLDEYSSLALDERYFLVPTIDKDIAPFIGMKLGQPILIHKLDTGEARFLALPTSVSGLCEGRQAVAYLINMQVICKTFIDSPESCQNVESFNGRNFYLGYQVSNNISIELQVCDNYDDGIGCQSVEEIPQPHFEQTTKQCNDIMKSMMYIVIHDGFNGIKNVIMQVKLVNISLSKNENGVSQSFAILFSSRNGTDDQWRYVKSGNPGYLVGLTVLVGIFKEGNNVLENNRFRIPTGDKPYGCDKSEDLMFGINVVNSCTVKIKIDKPETMCSQFQQRADKILEEIKRIDHIGMFGNSSADNDEDWIPILEIGSTNENFEFNGRFLQNAIVCKDVVSVVHFVMLYVQTGHKANPQAKIIGASRKYVKGSTAIPLISNYYSKKVVFVNVIVTASFIDVTNRFD